MSQESIRTWQLNSQIRVRKKFWNLYKNNYELYKLNEYKQFHTHQSAKPVDYNELQVTRIFFRQELENFL